MMHRLQVRLFAAFFLVIVVAVATVMGFVLPAAEQEIEIYAHRTGRLQLVRMHHWLLGYHSARGSWSGVQPFIEEMGVLYGQWVVLARADGTVVADSRSLLFGQPFDEDWISVPLGSEDGAMGTLYVSAESGIDEAFAHALRDSLSVYLLIGGGLALAVALLLTVVLSRAISAPVRELVTVARRAGTGDLSVQAEVADNGELGELATAFNTMVRDLGRAAELRRNLVADTAHELRSPLANINGYLEAMKDEIVEPAVALQSVEEDVQLLSHLVDDLQELALAEAGALRLHRQPEDMKALVERSVAGVKGRAVGQGVSLALELPDSLPTVRVDFQRITQVLHNVLVNALAHTQEGGAIEVSVAGRHCTVEVRVRDTGVGIPEEHRANVFERFYRVDRSRARATGGTGLGLTIARQLVELHGGRIWFEPGDPKGSVFVIELPISAAVGGDG